MKLYLEIFKIPKIKFYFHLSNKHLFGAFYSYNHSIDILEIVVNFSAGLHVKITSEVF